MLKIILHGLQIHNIVTNPRGLLGSVENPDSWKLLVLMRKEHDLFSFANFCNFCYKEV
jgi:hypothetical protein